MNAIEHLHAGYVAGRRARVIAARLGDVMPPNASVLDVGCGDGEIAWRLGQRRPDLNIAGVDVLVRERTHIPVRLFNGHELPYADNSFDVVSFVDVLHHCDEPLELLREARRVARHAIVIKDHSMQGWGAKTTLRFMDGVGNRRYGVAMPYNYLTPQQWKAAFAELDLQVEQRFDRLRLYPWPLSMAFDRHLHFVARLSLPASAAAADSRANLELVGVT